MVQGFCHGATGLFHFDGEDRCGNLRSRQLTNSRKKKDDAKKMLFLIDQPH
jgi:hypothetical protein